MKEEEMSRADALVAKGAYDQAIVLYLGAAQKSPLDEKLHVNMSYAFLHGRRFHEGISNLEDFLNNAEPHAVSFEIFMNLALLYKGLGEFGNALNSLRKAECKDRARVDLYLERADIQSHMGAHDDVIETFTEAQLACGQSWRLHNAMGCYYNDVVGEHGLAILHFTLAKNSAPDEPTVYNNLGIAQVAAGSYAEAVEQLSKAIKLAPDYCQAYHNLAVALYKAHEYKRASKVLEEVLGRFPEYAAANEFEDFLSHVLELDNGK